MYRSASRYDSRAIPEKTSRPARAAAWESSSQPHRAYGAAALEDSNRGLLRDPYLSDDAPVSDRNYQRGKGAGGTDFREAQRLAASFFSQQYPGASADAAYRDVARPSRALSPEIPMERYPPRSGQYRDRDVGVVERWPPERSNPEAVYAAPSRAAAPLVLEEWDDAADGRREPRVNLYGMTGSRGRKRDEDVWDDAADFEYNAVRKEPNYGPIQTSADLESNLRVTKRVDWTGLLRPEGSRQDDGAGLDAVGKRVTTSYRGGGGRFGYGDAYRNGLEEEFDAEGSSLYARRGGGSSSGYHGSERYREPEARKERAYFEERVPEFGLGGRGGGRGLKGKEDWRPDRDTSGGRGPRRSESDYARERSRPEERDSRRTFPARNRFSGGGSSGSGMDRGREIAEDYSSFGKGRDRKYRPVKRERASITNQDILAVYYGNPGHGNHGSKFGPPSRKSAPYSVPSRHHEDIRSERYRPPPRRPSRSPYRGKPRYNADLDSARKGKKRWEKPQVEGSEVKRFKRETQSDKLYLMHNSKATAEGKEHNGAASSWTVVETEAEKADEEEKRDRGKPSESAPVESAEKSAERDATVSAAADTDAAVEKNDAPEAANGLWDGDTWSESEEEKHGELMWGATPAGEEAPPEEGTGQERDEATFRALQSGAVDDSKKFLGECSEDAEDWESLASDLDDQLDDACVHQGSAETNSVTEHSHKEGMAPTKTEAQMPEETQKVNALTVTQSYDAVMAGGDDGEDAADDHDSEEEKDVAELDSGGTGVREGGEKKKVAEIMEELQENVKNREEKAFEHYVSLFERDVELKKLYGTNVNCGSFECLVCAGVGAKKKKKFSDVGSLMQHARKVLRTKKLPEHRGFARAICQVLGWESEPGPSVILPRSSEANVSASVSPEEQQKGGPTPAGMDWEWAAARQLFEEQEVRIDLTGRPEVELSASERVNSTGDLQPSEGVNSTPAKDEVDLVALHSTTRGKATGGDHDGTTVVISDTILMQDKAGTGKAPGGNFISKLGETSVEKPKPAPEEVSETITVSKNIGVVEPASEAVGGVIEPSSGGNSKSSPKSSTQPTEEAEGLAIGTWDLSPADIAAGDDSA